MGRIRQPSREVVRAVAALVDCNPFLPERVELERRALGSGFVPATAVWHAEGDAALWNPNAPRLRALVERVAAALRQRLAGRARATPEALAEYRAVVFYLLWQRYEDDWYALIESAESGTPLKRVSFYARFARDAAHFLSGVPGQALDSAHLFALGFQARRAFHYIFRQIFGGSLPAARLRAAAWQSIFTHDARRYRDHLYARMTDIPTLILGESGTGKELVARAIALSCYVPFDARSHSFAADPAAGFVAVNLSALSPTLIESELFGHRRGAFTGAVHDRRGWLETCGAHGAVFLDEIGELEGAIQVKLLRVLQNREFQRIGETAPRRFAGKLIAATHRDLGAEMRAGRFRTDLYYRIRADVIRTPTLREQLTASPNDLGNLLGIVARRTAGPEAAKRLAGEVEAWISAHLGPEYPWPGNIRELEQCVRNILVRGEYALSDSTGPLHAAAAPAPSADDGTGPPTFTPPRDGFSDALQAGTLTANQVRQAYCAHVYAQAGSYEAAARRLGLNWRTVQLHARAWANHARSALHPPAPSRSARKKGK
jgi:DNA-binding NtrC family response regulator